jgi:hypothetical protein
MESWMTVYNWPVLRCPQLAGFEVSPEGVTNDEDSAIAVRADLRVPDEGISAYRGQ